MESLVIFVLLLVIGVFYCYGVYIATRDDMVLKCIGVWSRKTKLADPLTECLSCMASLHGSYLYITYWLVSDHSIWFGLGLPIYVFALCGLNTFVQNRYDV